MTVEAFVERKRVPFADGRAFGAVGPYERIEGELHFAVDPGHPANSRIVDLALAPRDADGKVRFRSRLAVLRPMSNGNGRLLLDVPNRGRRLVLTSFNRVPRDAALLDPLHPGDGHLLEAGFSLATVGWQFDVARGAGFWCEVPEALAADGSRLRGDVVCDLRANGDQPSLHIGQLGAAPYLPCDLEQADAALFEVDEHTHALRQVPRAQWSFSKLQEGKRVADAEHVWLAGGFAGGRLYRLVFRAEGAPVVGCGLLAIRDAGRWLRHSPVGENAHVLGFGVSQTGRFLRQFLYEGMNVGEDGKPVFDAVWAHIAGGQRGDFNHRFAQPSAAGAPSFGQLPPFAIGAPDGDLAARCRAGGAMPKVFLTNTSWEYWRGDAALTHTDLQGRDLPADPDVRIYAIAGTQHIGGVFPPAAVGEIVRAGQPFSVVDFSVVMRALLESFVGWACEGREPPPSCHPEVADGTLVPRDAVLATFPRLSGVRLVDGTRLPAIRALELRADAGVAAQPVAEGTAYPGLVCAVAAEGNERAGVRVPDVSVPLGAHTGWNARHPDDGAPDLPAIFVGFTAWYELAELQARYRDEADYLRRVRAACDALVAARFLRHDDLELVLEASRARYRCALGQEF